MPFIQDILRKREEKQLENGLEEAIRIFDKQREALLNIKDTEGLKVILEFLESSQELYESKMDDDTSRDVFARYKAVRDLKRFIESRLKD